MTVLFLGPSAAKADIGHLLSADIRPPVAQGDVFRAVADGARDIGIIDGYFNSTPAVWHKEIAWALNGGVAVFGAASMGALRAVELAPLGMRGVGWVYNAFASGDLEDDDEVAIMHAPQSFGFVALSEAMVNIRCTIGSAETQGVLRSDEAQKILHVAKSFYYADRNWPEILDSSSSRIGRGRIDAFRRWLPTGRVDIKRLDALALVRTMREARDATSTPRGADFDLTALVERARSVACSGAAALVNEPSSNPAWRTLEERALLEALALERAATTRTALDEDLLLRAIAHFRDEQGVKSDEDLTAWLDTRQISQAHFLELLVRETRITQAGIALRSLCSRLLADRIRVYPQYRQPFSGTELHGGGRRSVPDDG